MIDEMSQVPLFFTVTKRQFAFLKKQFAFYEHHTVIDAPDDYREATARIFYVNKVVGVQIYWYFSSGLIDVQFAELLGQTDYPDKVKLFESSYWKNMPDAARGVNLSMLATVLGHRDDSTLLLKEYQNVMPRYGKKRRQTIEANLPGVISGLAEATQQLATPILQGDLSIFPQVIQYYTSLMQKLPGFF